MGRLCSSMGLREGYTWALTSSGAESVGNSCSQSGNSAPAKGIDSSGANWGCRGCSRHPKVIAGQRQLSQAQSNATQGLTTLIAEIAAGHDLVATRTQNPIFTAQQRPTTTTEVAALLRTAFGAEIASCLHFSLWIRLHDNTFQQKNRFHFTSVRPKQQTKQLIALADRLSLHDYSQEAGQRQMAREAMKSAETQH
jgi:hypothetical protein